MEQSLDQIRTLMDQFTESLAALVEGVQVVIRDEVAEVLSQYNDLVPACNERLQLCAGLLGKGLRDEALGYAADEPELLEAVDLLDIASRPQWTEWLDALQSLDFPQPVALKVDAAAALRAAQVARLTLKPLTDPWRRANISNAPLTTRIHILRRLRKADPNNESWFECLRAHEKQRIMEIEKDVRVAFASKNEERLEAIDQEFKAEWLEAPPARAQKAAESALAAIRSARINRDLDERADALQVAFDQRDLQTARSLRDSWDELAVAQGAFAFDDVRLLRAQPVLEWVGRHDRLESLFAEVWQSLDAKPLTREAVTDWVRDLGRMRDEVEDIAEKLRDDIDLEPIERLRSRVARIEEDQRRSLTGRRRLMYLAVGFTAVILAAVVTTATAISRYNDGVRRAVAEVDSLLAKVDAGEVVPESVPALSFADWLVADPVVQARMSQLQSAVEADTRRRQQFDESLVKINDLLESLRAAPKADAISPWPDAFAEASKRVAEVTDLGLTKTSEDKAKLTRAAGALDNVSKRLQRDADELVAGSVQAIKTRIEPLRVQAKSQPEDAVAALDAIEKEIANLRATASEPAAATAAGAYAQMTKASRAATRQLDGNAELATAVSDIRKSIGDWQRFKAAEQGIDEALGDWKKYSAKLEATATEFPREAVSRDYCEAAKALPLWVSLDAWNQFARRHSSFSDLSPNQAASMLAEFATLRDAAGKLGFVAKFIDRFESVLKSFADRDTAQVSRELESWLASAWLSQLEYSVTTNLDQPKESYRIYFCLLRPSANAASFKYVPSFLNDDGEWPSPRIESLDEHCRVDVSPQKQLADDLEKHCLGRIASATSAVDGDEALVDAVKRTLEARAVEPCIRMLTIRMLLMLGEPASVLFRTEKAEALLKELDDGNRGVPGFEGEDLATFVSPDRQGDPSYVKVRKFSERAIAKASMLVEEMHREAVALRKKLSRPEALRLQNVGRLVRDATGNIALQRGGTAELVQGDELRVINPGGDVMTIGTYTPEGRSRFVAHSLIAGTPVFVIEKEGRQ